MALTALACHASRPVPEPASPSTDLSLEQIAGEWIFTGELYGQHTFRSNLTTFSVIYGGAVSFQSLSTASVSSELGRCTDVPVTTSGSTATVRCGDLVLKLSFDGMEASGRMTAPVEESVESRDRCVEIGGDPAGGRAVCTRWDWVVRTERVLRTAPVTLRRVSGG